MIQAIFNAHSAKYLRCVIVIFRFSFIHFSVLENHSFLLIIDRLLVKGITSYHVENHTITLYKI